MAEETPNGQLDRLEYETFEEELADLGFERYPMLSWGDRQGLSVG
jgi:hypothetical protein